jgi:5,10-methylenetetrahydromethanopterin reductase
MEVWIAGSNVPGTASKVARRAESEGFDGLSFGDTQCINGDPFVGLTAAAAATTKLKLEVGVTNPVTRHPAVTACAIASLQVESGGRAVLGVGRGDSAVSKLGLPAASVQALEEYVTQLQRYLAGQVVDTRGGEARLEWLELLPWPKVPVDVAATGPRVIAVGARLAERLTFNVGADRSRLSGRVALARRVRREAGLDPAGLSLGAWVPVAPHPSVAVARDLVKGVTAVYARFQAMPGYPAESVAAEDAGVIRALGEHYDNSRHGRADAGHIPLLEDDFVERFAVVGPPERCIERLWSLIGLGLDRLLIVGPNRLGPAEDFVTSRRLLTDVVIPELRRLERTG